MDSALKNQSDPYNVPTEHEFAATTMLTGLVILVIAVGIAVGVTWFTTKAYEPEIHHRALRTAFFLPLFIVPLCSAIIGHQGYRNHKKMLAIAHLARTDEMTGLANRRAFMHTANNLLAETDFEYSRLGIFIIDLDHFKQVNDLHGHETGDQVLIHASNQIRAAVNEDCFVARLGGEEFGVLVPFHAVPQLHHMAEAIRFQVASNPCELEGLTIPVSASVGVGIAHPRDTVSSVLCRADDALYEAKDKGRNRFVVAA